MLKLVNVSKYYYNKGVVASGFTKVNLELDIGEFVVITGESGSGKSTLLNVISGLDTYEDGEMYINGLETSHYNEADFEEYRKKYIGNIFQNFNLVNSYTVYQNVELVLLLNGFKRKEVKKRVLDIIDKVGMTKFKKAKASKLSGGQKQRVAIARALAKETSIIVADEPTGNLDSQSSKSVLELLHEIAKDKLVVIVTHNYDQVEQYATRKIKMHDGKILEDKKIKNIDSDIKAKAMEYKNMSLFNKLRIGFRNTFNVLPKFLLLLAVFLFITFAVSGEYSSFQKKNYEQDNLGYNSYFRDFSENRLILKKNDKTSFSESDYQDILKIDNINLLIKNDLSIDTQVSLNGEKFAYYAKLNDINTYKGELAFGRMPTNENEVIIVGGEYEYDLTYRPLEIIDQEYDIQDESMYFSENNKKVTVVGIGYFKEELKNYSYGFSPTIYGYEELIKYMAEQSNINTTESELTINEKKYLSQPYMPMYRVLANDKVPEGEAFVSKDLRMLCKNFRCLGRTFDIKFNNLYFEDNLTLKITKEYTKTNFKSLTGLKNFDEHNGVIFVNKTDLTDVFNKGFYQSSVYVENVYKIDDTVNKLEKLDYNVLKIKDALAAPYMEDVRAFAEIFQVVFIAIITVALFFISYFIIKLIFKSRNIYFSTIRILGSSKEVAKRLLDIELLTVLNIAYLIFLSFVYMVKNKIIESKMIFDLSEFFKLRDYIILYIILLLMSYLISKRYSRKLFKKSAMNTYREEV